MSDTDEPPPETGDLPRRSGWVTAGVVAVVVLLLGVGVALAVNSGSSTPSVKNNTLSVGQTTIVRPTETETTTKETTVTAPTKTSTVTTVKTVTQTTASTPTTTTNTTP